MKMPLQLGHDVTHSREVRNLSIDVDNITAKIPCCNSWAPFIVADEHAVNLGRTQVDEPVGPRHAPNSGARAIHDTVDLSLERVAPAESQQSRRRDERHLGDGLKMPAYELPCGGGGVSSSSSKRRRGRTADDGGAIPGPNSGPCNRSGRLRHQRRCRVGCQRTDSGRRRRHGDVVLLSPFLEPSHVSRSGA